MRGASSVLPASERDWGPGAGPAGISPPGLESAASPAWAPAEPPFALPPHDVASRSGTATAPASSTRDLSATSRSLTCARAPAELGLTTLGPRAVRLKPNCARLTMRRASPCLRSTYFAPRCAVSTPACLIVRGVTQCSGPALLAAGQKTPL